MVSARWGVGITLAEPTPAATAIGRRLLPLTISVAGVTATIHQIIHHSRRSRNISRCNWSWPIMVKKRILRKNEVLERLGIRKTTLHESFVKTGRLRFVKIGAQIEF